MKKHLLLLITAALLSMASAFAQGGTTGPLTWNLNDGTLTISGTGAMPNYDWGAPPPWQPYAESIGAIVIENGVASIGNHAFRNCIYLASITMPNSVMIIGASAFSECYNLFSITIPNSVLSIGYAAFSGCSSLISVTIGNSVATIGRDAFSGCHALTSITIPSSVTTIGEYAFSGCHALTSITIPSSVTTIGEYAFNNCGTLSSINVESGNLNYSSTDGVLFDKEKTILIRYPSAKTNSSYTIPNSVTTIGNSAFNTNWSYPTALNSVTIPNSVTTIGTGAFSGCRALNSITIPNSVISIGEYAFSSCSALTSITIPNSVTTIGYSAFYNCEALTSINVESENVNYSSTDGVLFDKEKTILICYPTAKNNSSYTIPNSVTTIGSSAFSSCRALISVTIPNSVTTIGSSAFSSCSELASVTIGNSVTTIEDYAFSGCYALTSITIPNSVTTIEYSAFSGCSALTSITIPNSVTTIGGFAFGYCSALTSVTLGSGIATLGYNVFYYCTALASVTNLNPIPLELANDWSNPFYGLNINEITLKVLKSSVSAYQAAEVWKEFSIVGGTFLLVTVGVNNDEYGTATGGGYFEANETVTLTATPYPNYKFVNWTKNGVEVSTNNPYNFTATEDMELVANFEKEVGITKFELINVKIYPNPTTGELKIENGELKITNVEVYNVLGKKQLTIVNCQLSINEINISHLPAGVYFVRIETASGEVIKKILKE